MQRIGESRGKNSPVTHVDAFSPIMATISLTTSDTQWCDLVFHTAPKSLAHLDRSHLMIPAHTTTAASASSPAIARPGTDVSSMVPLPLSVLGSCLSVFGASDLG